MKYVLEVVKIRNALGLHTRPATVIVQLLEKFSAKVEFVYYKQRINARSVMEILSLAVQKNEQITIRVLGVDAELAMQALLDAFANKFGEIH
ncbi:MAG: HPr family phosphocarrier protein [Chlamydiota bacterium]